MARRTTGPLYIEPKFRDSHEHFLLLISNLSGVAVDVDIAVGVAAFVAPNMTHTWAPILTQTVTIPDNTVLNRIISVQDYPYWQFFVGSDGIQVYPALYLLKTPTNAVQDFPLVPTGDWVEELTE